MKYICPLIVVADIKKARALYEGLLGQKVKMDFGENVTFHGDFAIHLKAHYAKLIDEKEISTQSNNFELYFEDDNIEEIVNQLAAHGYEFVHPVREQPWRQRVVRFYDADGHIVEIGESMEYVAYRLSKEGHAIAKIAEITYLSTEVVEMGIKKYG